jgi:hypothetical protein
VCRRFVWTLWSVVCVCGHWWDSRVSHRQTELEYWAKLQRNHLVMSTWDESIEEGCWWPTAQVLSRWRQPQQQQVHLERLTDWIHSPLPRHRWRCHGGTSQKTGNTKSIATHVDTPPNPPPYPVTGRRLLLFGWNIVLRFESETRYRSATATIQTACRCRCADLSL